MSVKPFIFSSLSARGVGAHFSAATATAVPPEIRDAEKQGYDRGYQEGLRAGTEQGRGQAFALNQQVSSTLQSAFVHLESLLRAHQEQTVHLSAYASRLALEIARKVAGSSLQKDPLPLIEDTVRQCIPCLMEEPQVTLFVHPSLVEEVQKRLTPMLADKAIKSHVAVQGRGDLAVGDCSVQWQSGGATASVAGRWKQVEALLGHDLLLTDSDSKKNTQPTDSAGA